MEVLTINEDIPIVCKLIPTFPLQIKEGFDELAEKFGMEERAFYGISKMDADCNIIYMAAVTEVKPAEGEPYGYTQLTIPKGEYLSETIHNWMSKTDQIKDIFGRLMEEPVFDDSFWCVEWYKSDDEMMCMVRKKS